MASEAMSAFVRFFVRDDVSGPAERVRRKVEDLTQEMDEASKTAGKDLADGLNKVKGVAKTFATGLAAAGAGISAFAGGALALANETMEFQEDMGKLQTAFETTGHSAETAQSVYKDFVGLLGETDQSVEAANHLAELTNNQKELSDWGTIAAGVYAKFGDSLPLEGLTEAANHTAKLGEVQGPLADALEWAGHSTDEFNKQLAACNTEEERASLITATLNDIYSESGNKYRELNADLIAQREAQSNWTAALTEAGNAVRPFVTELTNIGAALVEKVTPHLATFSAWFQEKIPVMKAAIEPLKTAFQWFVDNLPTIAPIVAGIATAFLAYQAISGIVTAVSAAMAILRSRTMLMAAAQAALNLVMNLNPFVLIASLIAGLVAAFVLLWNTNDGFRAAVIDAWEKIKAKADAVFSWLGSFLSGIWTGIKDAASLAWDAIKFLVQTRIDQVKAVIQGIQAAVAVVSGVFDSIKTAISEKIEAAKTAVSDAIEKIKGFFDFEWSLPSLKLPHFSISGEFSIDPPSVPSFGIEWYAKGGIFDAATLLPTKGGFAGVGEAGPEAVAPIDVLLGYVRQAVAEVVGNGGGGYSPSWTIITGETDESKLARMIEREDKRRAYELGVI